MGFEPISYDAEADTLYVRFSAEEVCRTTALGDLRLVDYDARNEVVGIEFIDVSSGIALRDLPFAAKIEESMGVNRDQFKIVA